MKPTRCPVCAAPFRATARVVTQPRPNDDAFAVALRSAGVGTLVYERCADCGALVAVDDRRRIDLGSIYSSLPDEYWSALHNEAHGVARMVRRLLPVSRGDLWDVGCGAGGLISVLETADLRCHGLEPGARAVEAARARGLDVRQGTASTFGEERVADVVTMMDVLEHLGEPEHELHAVHKMLRSGGAVLALTGRADALTARVGRADWHYLECGGHVTVHSEQGLRRLFRRVGFSRVRLHRVEHPGAVTARRWFLALAKNALRRALSRPLGTIPFFRDHVVVVAQKD